MMAFARLLVFILLIELIFYGLLTVYFRSLKREELEKLWAKRHPDRPGDSRERDRFITFAMAGFRRRLKSWLTALVVILPLVTIAVIVFYVNYH